MREFMQIAVLGVLFAGLLGSERAWSQTINFKPNPPANGGGGGGGFGGFGGGYGGGGYGGFGLRNPYNPFSPYSPFNPLSPYSPYNPISPVSPYYNPYYAGAYTSAYLYNPIYNPGLLSRDPRVQMQAWGYANLAATNVYSYSNYYASNLQYQQAAATNYNTQLYQQQVQQQAMQQYANAANLSTQAAYAAMAAQQYQQNVINPYGPSQPRSAPSNPPPAAVQQPPQQPAPKYHGFSGQAATSQPQSYDPFAATSAGYGERTSGFNAQIKIPQPTYNEVQAKIAADRLQKIQMNASPGEIISASAQNGLLDDLRKFVTTGLKASMPDLKLPEDTLKELNVVKNGGNLGAIRNDGKLTWPVALSNFVLSAAEQKKLQAVVTEAVATAVNGKIDGNAIIGIGREVDDIRSKLIRKINDIPTTDYLEAKRFLNDIDEARFALQKNEWTYHMQFQKFIAEGKGAGRSVQDLAKFMVDSGFKFAPATSQDEGSYKALYSSLVAYDIQFNAQFAPQQLAANP